MPYTKTQFNEGAAPGISAGELNKIGQGIEDAYYQSQATFLENVTTTLIYTSGDLTRVDESVASVLRRRTSLSYTGGDLTSTNVKLYAENGVTVVKDFTDTLTYVSGELTNVSRVVA